MIRTAVVALAMSTVALAAPASADPVIDQPGGVYVLGIDPAPAGPAITVTLSNGATDRLRPCRYEDGNRCYWLAEEMGNGKGRSFVVTRGRLFYLNLTGFDPLA